MSSLPQIVVLNGSQPSSLSFGISLHHLLCRICDGKMDLSSRPCFLEMDVPDDSYAEVAHNKEINDFLSGCTVVPPRSSKVYQLRAVIMQQFFPYSRPSF